MALEEKNRVKQVEKGLQSKPQCRVGCPVGSDIPRWVCLVHQGRLDDALSVLLEKNPFPAICGHVCPAFCESKCRRREVDDAVAINALERYVTEQAYKSISGSVKVKPSGKRVAIVGSGPAGLTAAYYLSKVSGHQVTIFDDQPKAGGMMRTGIPRYRLPEDILDNEINRVKQLGVEIIANRRVDSMDELIKKGFDAIFVATGVHRSAKLSIEGEDLSGIIQCLEFLRDVSLGRKVKLGNSVGVVGGGNAAIDAGRTALRLGAKRVTVVYRRTRDDMPAYKEEVEGALTEGVEIIFLAAPSKMVAKNKKINMECLRMKPGEPDSSGRRQPIPVKGSEFALDFDNVIIAVGELPDVPAEFKLDASEGGKIKIDSKTLATSREGIFAGGDVVSGAASVVDAIAAGRKAAVSIDRYLGGEGIFDETLAPPADEVIWTGFEEKILDIARYPMPTLPPSSRIEEFAEVNQGFNRDMAIEESRRCLRCDQRVVMAVDIDKCIECLCCELICSLVYQGAFNLEKSRIKNDFAHREIIWSDQCIGGCSLCARYCPMDAIKPVHELATTEVK